MNIALYNPRRGHQLMGAMNYPGCTREEAAEMALLLQIEAQEVGLDLGSTLMVAWQDQPSQYMGVFTLGDETILDEDLLNGIESLARTRH